MIEALYQIGKILPSNGLREDWVDQIDINNYKHVFRIMFTIDQIEDIQYTGIELEENSPERKQKYLYKQSKGNKVNPTPTTLVVELQKTLCNKKRFFQNFIQIHKQQFSENSMVFHQFLKKCVELNEQQIFEDILKKCSDLGLIVFKNDAWVFPKGAVITLGFYRDGQSFYVGEISHFTDYLVDLESVYHDYHFRYGIESRGFNRYCYICQNQTPEVWGFVNTFNFYTLDKPGMVTGGFNQKNAWRNYPVCPVCAATLFRGKKLIDDHLIRRFCGFNYYIIPQLILPDDGLLESVLNNLKKIPDFTTQENKATIIQSREEEILRVLSRESNSLNFHFVFYFTQKSEFKILLHLQDIAPSRLTSLLNTMNYVDAPEYAGSVFEHYANQFSNQDKPPIFNFSFSLLRTFFPNSPIEGDFDALFLELVNNVFIGKNIDNQILLEHFMQKIRFVFLDNKRSPTSYQITVMQAYKIVLYVKEIKQLIYTSGGKMEPNVPYAEFFDQQKLLDDYGKRAVFLLGVLSQKLINIQYKEKRSTPFRSRLNNLKIDTRVVKRLLPEIINKLEEYKKNYYHELETSISHYFLNAQLERYSTVDLSFFFSLGLSLAKEFKTAKEEIEISNPDISEHLTLGGL